MTFTPPLRKKKNFKKDMSVLDPRSASSADDYLMRITGSRLSLLTPRLLLSRKRHLNAFPLLQYTYPPANFRV